MGDWAEMLSFQNASKYESKAEALIEILESVDCGSVGGYDKDNRLRNHDCKSKLYRRFLAVCRKYDDEFEPILFFMN